MRIAQHALDERILIVAEIGNNHEGSFDRAQEMLEAAARCGVDAVKFQTFRAKYYTSQSDAARFERLRSFELTYPQFERLEQQARQLGVMFISTPFDLESARFLAPLVDAFKIASGDNNFSPLLECVASAGKPVIVSTGMSDLAGVRRAVDVVRGAWKARAIDGQLAVLHCVSAYPVPVEQANVRAMATMAAALPGVTIGYSDHTLGIEACATAAALGARILEKHFTLDKHLSDFRDHQLSSDPPEMKALVAQVRKIELLLGDGNKVRQACEQPVEPVARRSIVAGRDLPAGHRLTLEDLTWIRPAGGLAPGSEAEVVGRALRRDLSFGERVTASDVE